MTAEMTILVKKSDGTQVRMTMDEFKIYRKQNSPKTENEPKLDSDLPVLASPHELSLSTPVKDIFIDEAVATMHSLGGHRWDKEDHQSLLEDVDHQIKKMPGDSSLPDQKHDLFSRVVKSLSFTVPDDLQSRFHSMVISYIKEIRSDEQLLNYATNDKQAGGLGLTNDQAQELLKAIDESKNKKIPDQTSILRPQVEIVKTEILDKPKNIMSSAFRSSQGARPILHDMVKPANKINRDEGVIVGEEANKMVVENEAEMTGPIDELRELSIIDFRRLSEDPAYAAEILLAKVQTLKKDSYSTFLQGVVAWHQSPLYKMYQDVVRESINRGVVVQDWLAQTSSEKLQSDEFISLIEMNKNLDI